MYQLLNLLSGKLRTKAAQSSDCLTTQLAEKAVITHPRRSLTQRVSLFAAGLALTASATFLSSTAQAQTYKAITLDGGGYTSGFATSANAKDRIYAYGDAFGAWRSDNKGQTWRYLNWNIPGGANAGTGLAIRQDNADIVFYSANRGLYRSTNGGDNWTTLLSDVGIVNSDGNDQDPPSNRGASPILINSSNTQEIWFAGPRLRKTGWLWKSTDGGNNFNKVNATDFDSQKAITVFQSPVNPSQIWVGAENGLYVTTNGGSNFTKITNTGSNLPSAHIKNVAFIQQYTSGTYKGVLLFTYGPGCCSDNGLARITSTTGDYSNIATLTASRPSQPGWGYPSGLRIFSDNTAAAWNTDATIQGYSTDGGQNFNTRTTKVDATIVPVWTTAARMTAKKGPDYGTDQMIQVGDNPDHWVITGGGAAMESTDKGVTWKYFPNGVGIAGVKTYKAGVSRFDENRMYIPASDIGSAVVTDGGFSGAAASSSAKFLPEGASLHNSFRIMEGPNKDNLVLAGINQGNNKPILMKSNDGGTNWTVESVGNLPDYGIVKAVMSPTNYNDFIVVLEDKLQTQKVYRTTNGGTNFDPVPGLPDNMGTGFRYDSKAAFIERDATLNDWRYFVSREPEVEETASDGTKYKVKYSTAFYKSTNGGANWSTTQNHPFVVNGKRQLVWDVVADPVRSKNLWVAGGGNGVKYSIDGGDTWNSISKKFDTRNVGAYDGKIAVWGKAVGEDADRLWYSPNNGANWYAQSTFERNFSSVQGVAVDSRGRIWVSWNSVTVVTPVTGTTAGAANANDLGFENGFGSNNSIWYAYGNTASINTDLTKVRSGAKSGYFSGGSSSAGANYTVTGLTAGKTYVVRAWVKPVSGSQIWITGAPTGASQTGKDVSSSTTTNWTQLEFTVVMGTATSARISAWVGNNSSAYFDDFTIEEKPSGPDQRVASAEPESSQQSQSLSLQLYPNPTSGEVNISLAGFEAESSVQVKMSDMNGKSFLRQQVQPRVAGKQVTLSVSQLPQGLFFVTVQGSKARKTAKLIITK
jgi:hypothetical protein